MFVKNNRKLLNLTALNYLIFCFSLPLMNFNKKIFQLGSDATGENIATLLYPETMLKSGDSILYLHGFSDYFFQFDVGNWFVENKINFFALDLRKYGRSILPHQKPNTVQKLDEYFEEISMAIEFIRSKNSKRKIFMLGHSTGGLIAPLYCAHAPGEIDGLILNSPFFAFNVPFIIKKLLPLISFTAKYFPDLKTPFKLPKNYGLSMHQNFNGTHAYDLKLKPPRGFPIYLSWIRAIHLGHQKIRNGLHLDIPVLVLHSHKSTYHNRWNEEAHTTDVILNVEDMVKLSAKLGKNLSIEEIKGAKHDILISSTAIKENALQKILHWYKQLPA